MNPEMKFDHAATEAAVIAMLSELLGIPAAQINGEHRLLEDLALDSLEIIELAMELEDRWNVVIERPQLEAIVTVRDVATLLEHA
ncbi:acyl carrier protein [Burkholderia ubonensis]|uniref:acyl carrier protein n=1 Tax=Burkholderia ubonensis TaxID=101571 RepID=UPI0008FE9DED|nr:phosphopantetheine-binding protein [Burkholderia ubonensis]OJA86355.1 hypothetical protein BGV49_14550 [Burkholderia ubonensis]